MERNMSIHFPFRYLEPTFFAGLLDDPVLLVRVRPLGSNLLFDCGQIHHLAKRVLTAIDALFISHAHMDHWMGIDTVTRHLHASSKTIDLYGPPGIAEKLGHRLAGYDWNLAENYWGSYRVHDVHPRHIESFLLSGPEGFLKRPLGSRPRDDRIIYRNRLVQVASETCDHRVDSLIFRISERPLLRIDKQQLERLGLQPGPWLKELKHRHAHPDSGRTPLLALRRTATGGSEEVAVEDVDQLCRRIALPQTEAAIGYISDVGFSAANRRRISGLLKGVQLLICENTFLREAKARARASRHLCSDDVNQLLDELRPDWFLPMHLSKSFNRRWRELYRELQPPAGTGLLELPVHVTPAPLRAEALVWRQYQGEKGEAEPGED
jgi:ribonuclease Z